MTTWKSSIRVCEEMKLWKGQERLDDTPCLDEKRLPSWTGRRFDICICENHDDKYNKPRGDYFHNVNIDNGNNYIIIFIT